MISQRHENSGAAKGLWAVCWRMLLLTPVALLGLLFFTITLGLSFLLPVLAAALAITGRILLAILALVVWVIWLRFGGPVRRFVFEGFEHGSL